MHDATWEVTTKVPPGRSQRARQRWLAPPFHPISILKPTVQRVLGIVVVFDVVVVVFVLFLVVVISVFFSDLHFKTRVQGRVPGRVARLLVPGCDRITGSDQEREATRSLSEAPRCFFT